MNTMHRLKLTALLCSGIALAPPALADDIDIFLGMSGGTGDAPNVMILIDNGPNWSRVSQGWPDPNNPGATITQGQAELNAMIQVLGATAARAQSQGQPINVGLALLTPYNTGTSSGGGYIRFGARDMTVPNNLTALQTLLGNIAQCVNPSGGCGGSANESLSGMSHKDETAAFYELYKYFSGLTPYTGGPNAVNTWDDIAGNLAYDASGRALTASALGLTSGFAIANGVYQTPISAGHPCAANYIIYIANNSQGSIGPFENVYEPTVVPALAALPASGAGDTWLDEWTRYLLQSGAVVPAGNNNGSIVTYVLDAYNKQNNAGYSVSLQAAAHQGGGLYKQVSTENAVETALLNIFEQIQAVNSTFASASLPVNATNRAQDQNQVYIPMFRPDAKLQPRWFGNLKQYQLINSGGQIELGDAKGNPAINPLTGFPTDCAVSFWTTDSTDLTHYPSGYWNFGISTSPTSGVSNTTLESIYAKGGCVTTIKSPYGDRPDGPIVEKGGVAEVIRKGNNPPATNSSPTWLPSARNVLTANASNQLVPFSVANTGLPAPLVNWVLGQDVQDENGNLNVLETRPSVHGDEIHSRPLPIDYGSGTVRVFYGSNDGTLRAVDGSTGQELWAFVAPEFYSPTPAIYPGATPTGLERLMWSGMTDAQNNQIAPLVYFPSSPPGVTPTPVRKDYFFDGSIGLYEGPVNVTTGASSPVWIYPSMRRGGRMLYGIDVTDPTSPAILWKFGCPDLTDDANCVGGATASSIGQTWSMPAAAASVLGWGAPVVIVGGGYDSCEDLNTPTPNVPVAPATAPPCTKGGGVYVLDARLGTQLAFFDTNVRDSNGALIAPARSVAADVALISVAGAGVVDHAYAVDTGGNIWRIDFNANKAQWVMNRVAYTNGAGRKFLFPPALLAAPGNQVYVAIGSGDREHPLQAQYPYTAVLNRFYVFKDNLASTTGALNLDDTTQMDDFTYGGGDPGPSGATNGTTCGTPGVLPASTMRGWFMNLNQNGQGEQTVTSAVIAAGMVAFNTNRPVPKNQGSCATMLGAAYGYWINLFNASGGISATGQACGGLRDSPFVGAGLPPSPVVASVPVNGQVVQTVIGAAQLSGGTSCGICPQQVKPAIVPTRKTIFWKGSGEN